MLWESASILPPLMVGSIAGSLLAMNGSSYLSKAYTEIILRLIRKPNQGGSSRSGFIPELLDKFYLPFLFYIVFIIISFLLTEAMIAFYILGNIFLPPVSSPSNPIYVQEYIWPFIGNNSKLLVLATGFFFLAVALLFLAIFALLVLILAFKFKERYSA